MAHSLLLVTSLLHLVLIALLGGLPARQLLAPTPWTRLAAGLVSGAAGVLITLSAIPNAAQPTLLVYPTMIAVSTFVFGGLAGGAAALVSIVLPFSHHGGGEITAVLQAVAMWGLGCIWFVLRTRWRMNVWLGILGLSLTMPLLLLPWLPTVPQAAGGAALGWAWLQSGPWRFMIGVLVLAGGVELLRSRAMATQELRLREEELQTAIEASGGGRWEWNVRTGKFSCNGAFYQDFGLEADACDDSAWQRWNSRRHPDDMVRIGPHLHSAMQGNEETYYAEFRMRDDHGQWRWLISRGRVAERDANGHPVRMVGMDLDITEHHELQEALRASETKYTTIYETLPDPAGITRVADGRYLDVNPAFTRILGREHHEILGKTSTDLGVWRSADERRQLIDGLRLSGEVLNLRMTAYRGDTAIPGLMSARTVRLGNDECMVFVFHDMTSEQKVRDELLASNRLLQQAGWLARLGVWEHSASAGLVYWSDVCYDIHGLTQGSPLPTNYLVDYVAPAWRDAVAEKFRQSLAAPMSWSMEIEILRADGQPVWVRVRGESVVEGDQVTSIRGVMQDIDESKRAEQRLRHSEERFARIFEMLPYPMGLSRRSDGGYVDVNPAWEQSMGYSRAEATASSAVGLGIFALPERLQMLEATRPNDRLVNYELEITTRSGEKRTVLQSMSPIDIRGEACWLFAIMDITDRQRAEQKVREREELLSLTISAATLGLWDWNMQTGMITGDARWRDTLGLTSEGPVSTQHPVWTDGFHINDTKAIALELQRHTEHPATPFDATWQVRPAAGGSRWIRNLGKIVSYDAHAQPLRMVGVSIDVTPQREQQEQLQKMAHYDALTGLPNRVLLAQRLQAHMEQARQRGQQLALAYLDLDGFKPVNDRLGHDAGDRLLMGVAERLVQSLRSTDCVARLGGDEFVILLPGLESRQVCERMLHTVMHSISAPYALDTERVVVTASIGYTLYPDDDADADALLRHADQAMYAAKQAGRNRFHAFDIAQERALQTQREFGAQISDALAQGQFVLYLQPKVDMRRGVVVGAEALARWQHPERGLLAPGAFLPLIENTELEVPFGEWVVSAALDEIERLHAQGLMLPISINISALHLQQQGFARWMGECLAARPGLPARMLDMEITESAALYDITHVAGELSYLRDLGISVSLGRLWHRLSSLTYLRRLPMDHLKLDQSFRCTALMTDSSDLAIVQGVIGLARSFGYRIVAEGGRPVEQGQMLLQMGCAFAQGYCIARPMPAQDFPGWAAQWQARLTGNAARPI